MSNESTVCTGRQNRPTAAEIRAECLEIQKTWSRREEKIRAGASPDAFVDVTRSRFGGGVLEPRD
jgi:hypothetical protein